MPSNVAQIAVVAQNVLCPIALFNGTSSRKNGPRIMLVFW